MEKIMNNVELQIASTEVMEVLPQLVKEDYDKIPKKFIEF
jgi:hypothetical protein